MTRDCIKADLTSIDC